MFRSRIARVALAAGLGLVSGCMGMSQHSWFRRAPVMCCGQCEGGCCGPCEGGCCAGGDGVMGGYEGGPVLDGGGYEGGPVLDGGGPVLGPAPGDLMVPPPPPLPPAPPLAPGAVAPPPVPDYGAPQLAPPPRLVPQPAPPTMYQPTQARGRLLGLFNH